MAESQNWQDVVDLDPKGYVEVQDHKKGLVFHGPIEKIEVDETDFVKITLKWTAKMGLPGMPGFGKWENADNNPIVFPNFVVPFVIENAPEKGRRVRFGFNIMYLDAIPGIDPSRVRGLVLLT